MKNTFNKKEYISQNNSRLFLEHFERYKFASKYTKAGIVLDIACGSGYGTDYLLKHGAKRVVGVDKSKEAVDEAKAKYLGEFCVMDATKLDFEDNYFDCVVSFETIEHLIEYKIFLDEIKRVVKPQGIVIISTPSYVFELIKFKYHVKNFRREEFINLFNDYFKDAKFFGQAKWFLAFPGRGYLEKIFKPKRSPRIYKLSNNIKNPQNLIGVGFNAK